MNNLYRNATNLTRCLLHKGMRISPATNIVISIADLKNKRMYYYCDWADNVLSNLYHKCARNEFTEDDYEPLRLINKEIEMFINEHNK